MASCPPAGAADGVRAARIVRAGDRLLFGPLRLVVPIGWIGVMYSVSKPIAAIAGRRASASRNVALRVGSVPCERGKISYQAAKRAAGPIDDQPQLAAVARRVAAIGPAVHELAELGRNGQLGGLALAGRAALAMRQRSA